MLHISEDHIIECINGYLDYVGLSAWGQSWKATTGV
jgi:hypothetical protein